MIGTVVLALTGAIALTPSPPGASRVSNVLIVVWDEVGWDDVAQDVYTPTFDGLRARGRTLRRFYVQPECSPTRASLLFGEFGFRHGIGRGLVVASTGAEYTPPVGRNSLPGLLKNSGIRTGLVGKWHLSNSVGGIRDEGARLQGFGNWRAGSAGNFRPGEDYGESPRGRGWIRVDDGESRRESTYATTAQTDAAIEWWRENQDERKFLVVAFNSAHDPYHDPPLQLVPRPSRKSGNRRVFENMIQAMDFETGRLLASVDLADTLVVVMSDNGTPDAVADTDQDPTRGKHSVYEGGIRVPCVVAGPGVPRGVPSNRLAHVADLFTTVCELMDVPVPTGLAPDSRSLVPLLERDEAVRTYAYSQRFQPNGFLRRHLDLRAVVGERYKLLWIDGVESFFDLQQDPGELRPLDPEDRTLRKPLDLLRQVLLDLEG